MKRGLIKSLKKSKKGVDIEKEVCYIITSALREVT